MDSLSRPRISSRSPSDGWNVVDYDDVVLVPFP
jgi:hypothetical protein